MLLGIGRLGVSGVGGGSGRVRWWMLGRRGGGRGRILGSLGIGRRGGERSTYGRRRGGSSARGWVRSEATSRR